MQSEVRTAPTVYYCTSVKTRTYEIYRLQPLNNSISIEATLSSTFYRSKSTRVCYVGCRSWLQKGYTFSLTVYKYFTFKSRCTTPIWWQCKTASRICWMQWLERENTVTLPWKGSGDGLRQGFLAESCLLCYLFAISYFPIPLSC